MKKVLLLSIAAVATLAASADFTPGQIVVRDDYTLTLEWANVDMPTNGTDLRMGIGAADRFFWADKANKAVKVYNQKGFEQDVKFEKNVWTNISCDQAGHVIVRVDDKAFDGNFATTAGVAIIDAGSLDVIQPYAQFASTPSTGRFDGFSQIYGDATGKLWRLFVPRQYGGCISEYYFQDTECFFGSDFTIDVSMMPKTEGTTTATVTSTANAVQYGSDGSKFAAFVNPIINVTDAANNLANTIMVFEEIIDEDGNPSWEQTGKFIRTPNHIGVGGFVCFTLNGKDYIAYPTGNGSADGFGVCEIELVDSPVSEPVADELRADCLKAIVYAASTGEGALQFTANFYWRGMSVEAVEGDPNSVYIYNCGSAAPNNMMAKWKFTVPAGVGAVNDIEVADENAPVEYFNLQGIRVANPGNGLFIKRQGGKATKVAL